jgi:hypothetical protein
MTIFPPHVTLYKYCRRNSVVEEAKKQSHPYHVFIYAPYVKVTN